MLRDIARTTLGEALAERVWKRIEIVGDIAVLRKPINLDVDIEMYRKLATQIMSRLPYIKSVWLAITPVKGSYRVRDFVHLAGEPRSETIYKEHGCLFKLDIRKVYVSPALNFEHIRVARLVKPGEDVLNMFAGVGLFSIIVAKRSSPKRVLSVDVNPDAYGYMVENVKLNKVADTVIPVLGDSRDVARSRAGSFDRVLMPLPELAYHYFEDAVLSLKKKGVIHVYEFVAAKRKDEAVLGALTEYLRKCEDIGVKAEVLDSRVVRSVGPRYYQVVLDLQLEKTS